MIIDCGNLGPSYQPGHAHCDLLSYEYSYKGERFIVDTGVGNYLPSEIRQKARSIYAHNTVVVNQMEQGEIWKAFRMGKRIDPDSIRVKIEDEEFIGSYSNMINKKYSYKHNRKIKFIEEDIFIIIDEVFASKYISIENLVHFHPGCQISFHENKVDIVKNSVEISMIFKPGFMNFQLDDWFYTPEFNKSIKSKRIIAEPSNRSNHLMIYAISSQKNASRTINYLDTVDR